MSKKETKINFEGVEEIATENLGSDQQQESPEVLTDQQMQEVADEVELERRYGDQTLRTFVERAASGASFGLSDQALVESARKLGGDKAALEVQKGLREREARNKAAALTGEVTGVVAPALMSGGTSIIAKGAGAGVRTAAKAGMAAENITAKQLAKLIQQTGRKKLASNVITKSLPKTAGSAVESAAYGAGQLIKEDALGNEEFNAENLAAYMGAGALIGGAAGGIIGTTEALIPVVKNNKVVDIVSKKLNKNINKTQAATELIEQTSSETSKMAQTKWGQEVLNNTDKFLVKNLKLKRFDSKEKLFKKASDEVKRLGEEIGDTALKIDKVAGSTALMPTRSKIALRVQNTLRELEEPFLKNPDLAAKKSLKKIQSRIEAWDDWLSNDKVIKATDIKELKTNLQKAAKWSRSMEDIPLDRKMDRKVAEAVRQEFLELADGLTSQGVDLGEKLKKLNLDYATGLNVSNKLNRALNKQSSKDILGFKDLLLADIATELASGGAGIATGAIVGKKFLESDFKRKLILLTDIEKANIKVNKKIASGIKNFFTAPKRAAIPASTKVLLNTTFSLPDERGKRPSKPKNKKEAFKRISEDLIEIQANPDKLLNYLTTNALLTSNAAPKTATALNATLTRAVQFLAEKLPKDPSPGSGIFAREWEPSSIELSKFERYLQAVENPMSVLDDLESGAVTKEAVEALKVVYPDIYQRVQDQAIELIAENPKMAYNKRIQIGILLDLPSDSSLLPQNVTALQQQFADEEQQKTAAIKPEGAVNTTQGGLNQISMAEGEMTDTQQVATRKQE